MTIPTLLSCIEKEVELSTMLEELITGTAMASLAALNHGPYFTNGNHTYVL